MSVLARHRPRARLLASVHRRRLVLLLLQQCHRPRRCDHGRRRSSPSPDLIGDLTEAARVKYGASTLGDVDVEACLEEARPADDGDKAYQKEDLSLSSLAAAVGLSSHQLSELVNTRLGMGFSRYVRERRVEAAKALLVSARRSRSSSSAWTLASARSPRSMQPSKKSPGSRQANGARRIASAMIFPERSKSLIRKGPRKYLIRTDQLGSGLRIGARDLGPLADRRECAEDHASHARPRRPLPSRSTAAAGLRVYDALVMGVFARHVWGCAPERPRRALSRARYGQPCRHRGRDGLLPGPLRLRMSIDPRLALIDLQPNCLEYAARRLARFHPRSLRPGRLAADARRSKAGLRFDRARRRPPLPCRRHRRKEHGLRQPCAARHRRHADLRLHARQ